MMPAVSMFGSDNTVLWGAMAFFVVIGPISAVALALVSNRATNKYRIEEAKRQDAVAAKLVAANESVAVAARETLSVVKETAGLTKVVHTLVNSGKTEGLETERRLSGVALALLREMIEVKKSGNELPTIEKLAEIEAFKSRIAELDEILAERAKQGTMAEVLTENIELQGRIDRGVPG
jgi:hypothetical protein